MISPARDGSAGGWPVIGPFGPCGDASAGAYWLRSYGLALLWSLAVESRSPTTAKGPMSIQQPLIDKFPENDPASVRNQTAFTRPRSSADAAVSAETDDVSWMISQVTRRWVAAPDVAATLTDVTSGVLAAVTTAQSASVAWAHGRWLIGRAPTHRAVSRLDAWQAELRQGPCLDALREQQTVVISDMGSEGRWPMFAARATAMDVGSMLSMPLAARREQLGVLNLYATRSHAFTGEDKRIGAVFATRAAIDLCRAVERDRVRALASHDVIGQATGIVMWRHDLTALAAIDRLERAAEGTGLTLSEVACWLVEEHDLQQRAADPGPRQSNRWV